VGDSADAVRGAPCTSARLPVHWEIRLGRAGASGTHLPRLTGRRKAGTRWSPFLPARPFRKAGREGDEMHRLRVAMADHSAGPGSRMLAVPMPDEGIFLPLTPALRGPKDGRDGISTLPRTFRRAIGTGPRLYRWKTIHDIPGREAAHQWSCVNFGPAISMRETIHGRDVGIFITWLRVIPGGGARGTFVLIRFLFRRRLAHPTMGGAKIRRGPYRMIEPGPTAACAGIEGKVIAPGHTSHGHGTGQQDGKFVARLSCLDLELASLDVCRSAGLDSEVPSWPQQTGPPLSDDRWVPEVSSSIYKSAGLTWLSPLPGWPGAPTVRVAQFSQFRGSIINQLKTASSTMPVCWLGSCPVAWRRVCCRVPVGSAGVSPAARHS